VSTSSLVLAPGTPELTALDKKYYLAVTATDFLGSSSTGFAQILKQSEPSPQVQFSPPYIFTTRDQPIVIVGKAVYSSCDFGQNVLNFTWRLVSGDGGFPLKCACHKYPPALHYDLILFQLAAHTYWASESPAKMMHVQIIRICTYFADWLSAS
jgi:hypothetical protein